MHRSRARRRKRQPEPVVSTRRRLNEVVSLLPAVRAVRTFFRAVFEHLPCGVVVHAPLLFLRDLFFQRPYFFLKLKCFPILFVKLPLHIVQVGVRIADVALNFNDASHFLVKLLLTTPASRRRVVRSDAVFNPKMR